MGTVQIIALIAAGVFMAQVVLLTARHQLRDRHAFVWLLLSLLGLGAAAALPAFDSLAGRLGVAYPPTAILLAGFVLTLSILMYHSMVLSNYQQALKTLAQEIAYLRREVLEARCAESPEKPRSV